MIWHGGVGVDIWAWDYSIKSGNVGNDKRNRGGYFFVRDRVGGAAGRGMGSVVCPCDEIAGLRWVWG